jgi:hypothetical protein
VPDSGQTRQSRTTPSRGGQGVHIWSTTPVLAENCRTTAGTGTLTHATGNRATTPRADQAIFNALLVRLTQPYPMPRLQRHVAVECAVCMPRTWASEHGTSWHVLVLTEPPAAGRQPQQSLHQDARLLCQLPRRDGPRRVAER